MLSQHTVHIQCNMVMSTPCLNAHNYLYKVSDLCIVHGNNLYKLSSCPWRSTNSPYLVNANGKYKQSIDCPWPWPECCSSWGLYIHNWSYEVGLGGCLPLCFFRHMGSVDLAATLVEGILFCSTDGFSAGSWSLSVFSVLELQFFCSSAMELILTLVSVWGRLSFCPVHSWGNTHPYYPFPLPMFEVQVLARHEQMSRKIGSSDPIWCTMVCILPTQQCQACFLGIAHWSHIYWIWVWSHPDKVIAGLDVIVHVHNHLIVKCFTDVIPLCLQALFHAALEWCWTNSWTHGVGWLGLYVSFL